jgi:hypothetical protein
MLLALERKGFAKTLGVGDYNASTWTVTREGERAIEDAA